jgi:hypothetical protein
MCFSHLEVLRLPLSNPVQTRDREHFFCASFQVGVSLALHLQTSDLLSCLFGCLNLVPQESALFIRNSSRAIPRDLQSSKT